MKSLCTKKYLNRRSFVHGALSFTALSLAACPLRPFGRRQAKAKNSLKILLYSDVHAIDDPKVKGSLLSAARAISDYNFDIAICGGDLVSEGLLAERREVLNRWRCYNEFQSIIKGDKFSVIGNHDLYYDNERDTPSGKELFCEQVGLSNTFYSFDALGYHFVFLDSVAFTPKNKSYHGEISGEQLDWLKGDLAKYPKETPIILTTHLPLLSIRYQASDGGTTAMPRDRIVENNLEVMRLFKERNLLLVNQGHLHIYEKIFWQNTLYLTAGAVCGGWWQGDWMGTPPGFCMLELEANLVKSNYVSI